MQILNSMGLTDNEAKIYLALLKLGNSNATELSNKANIHRTNIYDSLNRLIEKGLAAYIIKDNRKIYEACNPKKLKSILKETEDKLEKSLPDLESIYNSQKKKNNVKIFEGKPGLKTIFDDFIIEGKDVLMYGVPSNAVDILKYFLPQYHRERVKKKISTKAIFNADAKDRMNIIKDMKYASAKYLPGKYKSPASTNIYGNKIAIILWGEQPLIIQIESKDIADAYRNYFEIMWKISKG